MVPGSEPGRYEYDTAGFLTLSFRGTVGCWRDAKEGGPGRISVARDGSPSKWGGCDTDTPGRKYAGTLSTDAIPERIKRTRDECESGEPCGDVRSVEVVHKKLVVSGDDGGKRQASTPAAHSRASCHEN